MIDRLMAERPMASDLELGLIKQRVRGRVEPSARRSRRTEFMRSRLAILAMLVFGMVLSTGGGALAVSGFTNQQGNAAQGQYGQGVQGEEEDNGEQGVLGEDEESGGGAPSTENGGPTQPARQVEAGVQESGEQLPFTGFAAIPILLFGVGLLTAGVVLRRRSGADSA